MTDNTKKVTIIRYTLEVRSRTKNGFMFEVWEGVLKEFMNLFNKFKKNTHVIFYSKETIE